MSGKLFSILMTAGVLSILLVSGCAPSADLNLKFSADRTTAYKATTETVKLFRFDQPNLGKLKEEQTKTLIEMEFTQTIQSVDADGNATAKITIDQLKIEDVKKNELQFSFDSRSESDKNTPLAKVLGTSYTIQISPDGRVKVVDVKEARAALASRHIEKVAKSILDAKLIVDRHQATLPQDMGKLSVEDTWTQTVPSPPGLLAPKTYEKTYTLTDADEMTATIQMVATEAAEAASDTPVKSGMGMFAKMFDNVDEYTGAMKIDLVAGQIIESVETLISTYTAQEMPENGDPEKGPDTLTMQFVNRIQLERLD